MEAIVSIAILVGLIASLVYVIDSLGKLRDGQKQIREQLDRVEAKFPRGSPAQDQSPALRTADRRLAYPTRREITARRDRRSHGKGYAVGTSHQFGRKGDCRPLLWITRGDRRAEDQKE
jgi:hypothetical protein